jgi:hypothetical protein
LNAEKVEAITTRPRRPIVARSREARRSPYPHPEFIPDIRVVVLPGATSAHLSAQSGLFTLQKEIGNPPDEWKEPCLEDDPQAGEFLQKYTLPISEASALLSLCQLHHVTAATLYRSYSGAAEAVLDDTRVASELPLGANPSAAVATQRVPRVARKIALIGPSGSGAIQQLRLRYGSEHDRNMDRGLDTATPQSADAMLDWMRKAPPGFVSVSVHEEGIKRLAQMKRQSPGTLYDIYFVYLATEPVILKQRLVAEQGNLDQLPGTELLAAFEEIADKKIDTSYFTPEQTRTNIDAALAQAGVVPI